MLVSLFEIYDSFTFFMGLSCNWFFVVSVYFIFGFSYWLMLGTWTLSVMSFNSVLVTEFSNFFTLTKSTFGALLFISLFFYLVFVNLLGLLPYVFACSAHLVFSMSLSFPFWSGFIVMGLFNFFNSVFIHFIPMGTPLGLIPFMVVIESVSNFIRPSALSIRLMANIVAGHLVMGLLGSLGISGLVFQSFFAMFEVFVCLVQAYVFSALLLLYFGEV